MYICIYMYVCMYIHMYTYTILGRQPICTRLRQQQVYISILIQDANPYHHAYLSSKYGVL